MGSSQSIQLDDDDSTRLSADSSFSREELQRLYSRFISLDKEGNGALAPADLERIPELCINPIGARLISSFFPDPAHERMNFTEFVRALSHFRADRDPGTEAARREKLLGFLFSLYDDDDDGAISADDLQSVLRELLGKDANPAKVREVAQRTIREATGGGSLLTFADFQRAMAGKTELLDITFLD